MGTWTRTMQVETSRACDRLEETSGASRNPERNPFILCVATTTPTSHTDTLIPIGIGDRGWGSLPYWHCTSVLLVIALMWLPTSKVYFSILVLWVLPTDSIQIESSFQSLPFSGSRLGHDSDVSFQLADSLRNPQGLNDNNVTHLAPPS